MTAQRGFTLLEVLVALAVLGLLLGLLADGLHLGMRARAAQARLLHGRADLDAVDRALRRLIATAEPGNMAAPALFDGRPDRLAFSVRLPEGAGIDGVADLGLGVAAGHRLVLRYAPHLHVRPLGPPPTPRETVLLEGVAGLDLAYWPRLPPWGWRRTWAGPGLPGLVRLRIVFVDKDARHWPDLVVAPLRARLP